MQNRFLTPWETLAKWSPLAFIIVGIALLAAFALVMFRTLASVTVPEALIALFVLPSFFFLFFVALPGYYPYVANAASRLALGGALATGIGGAALLVITAGSIILALTTETGFLQAEDNPILLVMFFVLLLSMLLSFLLYGIGSTWHSEPSRLVGVLMLLIILEPGSGLLLDLVGVDLGRWGGPLTLGLAAIALVAVGLLLRQKDAEWLPEPQGT